jgi:5'(3')-deoxyribonucleotidase
MIKNIALDIDGVLSDFNANPWYSTLTESKESWVDTFPKFVYDKGFEKLKTLPDAFRLVAHLMGLLDRGVLDRVYYLSSAGNIGDELYYEVARQKITWLERHFFPPWIPIVVPNKQAKAVFATKETLLIDDQLVNVESFIGAGGHGILHLTADDTISILEKQFNVR